MHHSLTLYLPHEYEKYSCSNVGKGVKGVLIRLICKKLSVNMFTPFHVVISFKFWKIIKNFETEIFILSENSICKFLENALMLT